MPREPEKKEEKCLTQSEVSQLLQERVQQERRRYANAGAVLYGA